MEGDLDLRSQVVTLSSAVEGIKGDISKLGDLLSRLLAEKSSSSTVEFAATPKPTRNEPIYLATSLERTQEPSRRPRFEEDSRRASIWDCFTGTEPALDRPSMVYQRPEYTGRILEKLEIAEVIAFFDDINKFVAA
jgi:hypothetical protein